MTLDFLSFPGATGLGRAAMAHRDRNHATVAMVVASLSQRKRQKRQWKRQERRHDLRFLILSRGNAPPATRWSGFLMARRGQRAWGEQQ